MIYEYGGGSCLLFRPQATGFGDAKILGVGEAHRNH